MTSPLNLHLRIQGLEISHLQDSIFIESIRVLVLQTNNIVPTTTTRKSIAFFRMKLDGFFEAINQCHFAAEISERTTLT